jgi:uncharacterized protein (TIGR02217 family)
MSNALFPSTLPGIKWGGTKTPIWSTKVQRSAAGRELRAAYYSYPLYKFSLSYEVLRAGAQAELQQLVGFFNARQGSFDSFLYFDPDDNAVVNQNFGVGTGAQTQFQLVRTFGGFVEPVIAPQTSGPGVPAISVAGALRTPGTHYSISDSGLVTFTTAPAAGQVLTWTGEFYYRCRFLQDSADFERMMYQLWSLKKIEFQSVKA